jgi:hypothetical protein
MILSIHQPHIFPWLGYFDKMIRSDVFIYLDNVQFTKNYFQNRTKIKSQSGDEHWLTLPVKKAPLETAIKDMCLSDIYRKEQIFQKLLHFYSKADYWNTNFNEVYSVFNEQQVYLSSLNINSIEFILKQLEYSPQRFLASEMNLDVVDPNLRLIKYCQELNCDVYLAGAGGKKYMDLELFRRNGIEVRFQDFRPENYIYNQINGDYLCGLSVLDVIFNVGTYGLNNILFDKVR